MKVKQTEENLKKYFSEELELLQFLCDSYDEGKTFVAKQMATVIRVLLHDTENSHALLSQLNMKGIMFFDSCTNDDFFSKGYVESFVGIVGISIGDNASYTPYLDEIPGKFFGLVPFNDYWQRIIIRDSKKECFTREYLILKATNQDGGAHIGSSIDKKYASLIRENTMGWKVSKNNSETEDLNGIELATIRQISHEILKTLIPSYKKKMVTGNNGITIGGMGISVLYGEEENKIKKVGRNDKCPCGSNLKYKKCHGK